MIRSVARCGSVIVMGTKIEFVLVLAWCFLLVSGSTYDASAWDEWDAKTPAPKSKLSSPSSAKFTDVCIPEPLGGVPWILSVRQSDFGWQEHTHRAVLALAVNKWGPATPEEIFLMTKQLEVELTKSYYKNGTSTMNPNDLALYIHALVAIGLNPQNFFGIDLVTRLEKIVDSQQHRVHPFLLLALCNANRLTPHHVQLALNGLKRRKEADTTDNIALALTAYECAETRGNDVDEALVTEVRNKLIALQHKDGSFGNVYTTALVAEALASADWSNRKSALAYLEKRSTVDVNMISTYRIQMALNARRVRFIHQLHPDLKFDPVATRHEDHPFLMYSLRIGRKSDVYFTISIRRAPEESFFDVMKKSAQYDSKFNFTYVMKDNKPFVNKISDVSNDVETLFKWTLCLQTDVSHDRHDSRVKTIKRSPAALFPKEYDHVLYWYSDADCEALM